MKGGLLKLWEGWKAVARRIGEFQSRVLLTILYLILIGPVAVLLRPFSDPLRRRARAGSYWLPRSGALTSLDQARRQ